MSFATILVGLLVVSALTQATNYGAYRPPYYNYNYRRPYYHHYNYHHYQPSKVGPGPAACGSDPYKLPNCQGKSTLNLDTCQCVCPVPSEFCSKGYHFSQVFCECVPNGPPPPVLPPPVPLPPPLPPRPLPPVRPACRPCTSPFAVLDQSDCSCDCPASAQSYCVYHQVLDPVSCTCFCPANAADRCGNHETLDRTTCRCNPGPNPPSCPVNAARCNNLQVFDPVDCRCECVEVIVVTTERTPGERPGTPQVVETTVTRPGTPRTPGGRRKTGTSRGTSRRRRDTGAHVVEKRRKSRSPGTRPSTRTTTLTTIPGTPGRPGNLVETRRRIPAPCPSGYIEDSGCECLRL